MALVFANVLIKHINSSVFPCNWTPRARLVPAKTVNFDLSVKAMSYQKPYTRFSSTVEPTCT